MTYLIYNLSEIKDLDAVRKNLKERLNLPSNVSGEVLMVRLMVARLRKLNIAEQEGRQIIRDIIKGA